ncbi:Ribosome-releasing factor 2, mitochondrial [Lignoscripta atroalba]|nr:Ribosome-releasing factor 2, mitochondrial [Lignoscripta atroalba]
MITDVDDGSTVTDFLPAERARGITIQSAAITFNWPPTSQEIKDNFSNRQIKATVQSRNLHTPHIVNLIDTPGHADFTFEVLRSLRVLDGAVCILDGVAGVEAQTEKVWYQAGNYRIPKIIYINKLDRDGAAFSGTVKEIASRLHTWPAVCQIPWYEGGDGRFVGVVDVVSLKALRWPDHGDGKSINFMDMAELRATDARLADETRRARIALVEILSEHDDLMVEKYLECDEDHIAISPIDITESLRKCLLNGATSIVPVFAGASFRNIGVQPLLDAVVDLLPSPDQSPDPEVSVGNVDGSLGALLNGKLVFGDGNALSKQVKGSKSSRNLLATVAKNLEACALAFKVVNDPKKGVLVYVRVYHGSINRSTLLFNTNLQVSERAPRLLKMYASDAVEITSIPAGQIGVITGLKHARTGDTLISYISMNTKTGPPSPLNTLQLRPIDVPPPVFFASIEPQSLSEEKPVADALSLLLREDPSLQLSIDEDSGQTLLSGMGELHLEIARDRLIQDFRAKASMGHIEIGYRESILARTEPQEFIFERDTAGKKGKAGCTASVRPWIEGLEKYNSSMDESTSTIQRDGNLVDILITNSQSLSGGDSPTTNLPSHLPIAMVHTALRNGAFAALARGPQHSFALHSTQVSLKFDISTHIFGTDTTPAALSSAARLATQSALKHSAKMSSTVLMEPVMNVIISVDEASLGPVVHDISSSRGGHILSLDDADVISVAGGGGSREDLPYIDIRKVYAPPDPFASSSVAGADDSHTVRDSNRQRSITARVPLKEMVGYLKHLRSLTGGRGTFVMSVDRFERMGSQREKTVLKEMRGM